MEEKKKEAGVLSRTGQPSVDSCPAAVMSILKHSNGLSIERLCPTFCPASTLKCKSAPFLSGKGINPRARGRGGGGAASIKLHGARLFLLGCLWDRAFSVEPQESCILARLRLTSAVGTLEMGVTGNPTGSCLQSLQLRLTTARRACSGC